MLKLISEVVRVDQAIAPVDYSTADRTSSYIPMENYRQVQGVLNTATVAAASNATIQLMQAQDASGTGAKALSAVVSKVAAAGGEAFTLDVEANASDLDVDFTHVAVQITSDQATAVNGSAVFIRGNGRHGTSQE